MTPSEPESAGGGTPVPADNRPAPRQRTTPESRVEGLTPPAIRFLQTAARSLDARDFDTAAGALRQARSIAPTHPEILRIEAVLEYRRGRLAEATALLKQVLAAWPDDAMALFKRAQVSVLLNEPDKAAKIERARQQATPATRALIANERLFQR